MNEILIGRITTSLLHDYGVHEDGKRQDSGAYTFVSFDGISFETLFRNSKDVLEEGPKNDNYRDGSQKVIEDPANDHERVFFYRAEGTTICLFISITT